MKRTILDRLLDWWPSRPGLVPVATGPWVSDEGLALVRDLPMGQTIWQVWDRNDYGDRVVATYYTEALARDHAETFGLEVESEEVLFALDPRAADLALSEQRQRKRQAEAAEAQRVGQGRAEREQREREWRQTVTIEQMSQPSLCHCLTFSDGVGVSPHGCCVYCGGWTAEVFRAARGEAALSDAIDLLDARKRSKMREICGLPPQHRGGPS